jgi:glycosyltransferase involved in cell wall biosynthesis
MLPKIKVAFFAEILIEDFDGASRTIFQLIKSIPQDRFEFLFFCGVAPKTTFQHEIYEVPTIALPFNKGYKMAIPFFHKDRLNRKLDTFAPDVIHISTPSPLGNAALEYSITHDIPVISIYHTHFLSYVDYYLENFKVLVPSVKQMMTTMLKKFYHQCSLVYMPTQIMISELSNLGFSDSNMKLWPRGLDATTFDPAKRDVSLLKKITHNNKPNLLFASRLVWEKNLKTLVKIYQKIEDDGSQYNIIIAGDGMAFEDLKKMMPHAFFLGKLSHEVLAKVYASADIFVFTSISESYGNVVAEAMASGLPCVIANGGGSASFIDHGMNGFLCDPENENDYINHIKSVLRNENLRNQFIQKGLEKTRELKWSHLTSTYFADVESLASVVTSVAV